MKAVELRGKSEAELVEMERELRDELFRLRMKHFTGQLQRVSDLNDKRRDIARVLTVLSEKTVEGPNG
jgi:large subunit ribosomal protein L29